MFEVDTYDKSTNTYAFGKGGNQGARGNNKGGDWFVENLPEELDYPGEFYYDEPSGDLYLWHNGTGSPPVNATVVVPQTQVLLNLTGTQWDPVKGVSVPLWKRPNDMTKSRFLQSANFYVFPTLGQALGRL